MLQIDFTEALLDGAKDAGLHCCIETCGHCEQSLFDRVRDRVDLWLYDLKETDPERHREYTGVDNALILDNLRHLHAVGETLRLRCPVIPEINDREEHFRGIAQLAGSLPRIEGVELMPYHRLGESKLDRLGGAPSARIEAEAPSEETVGGWVRRLRALGVPVLNEDGTKAR